MNEKRRIEAETKFRPASDPGNTAPNRGGRPLSRQRFKKLPDKNERKWNCPGSIMQTTISETITMGVFMKTKYNRIIALLASSISIGVIFLTFSGCSTNNSPLSPGQNGTSPSYYPDFNTESYAYTNENPFVLVTDNPLSTFSADVDAASYTNCRRYIQQGQLPPKGAVRTEEFVNYFKYSYPEPAGTDPIASGIEISSCPWNSGHKLCAVRIKAKEVPIEGLPPANLTFLLDVSGSMDQENKLPLVKSAFLLLVNELRPQDRVAIVTYSSTAQVVLASTPGSNKETIIAAINSLAAGGSTAGAAGLQLAYSVATGNFIIGGNNRVILATDGDFNVGESSDAAMVDLIEQKRATGVYLSVLGFGMGNYKDSKMESLADHGNGNYAYVDGLGEARRVFMNEFGGTLFTVAKNVKLQVEFNPARVKAYRLIGYEDRTLSSQDFNNDQTDAGDMGAGQAVTAFYEMIDAGSTEKVPGVDSLRYQSANTATAAATTGEYLFVKVRYVPPSDSASRLISTPATDDCFHPQPSQDFIFAAAVTEFALVLRNSQFKGAASLSHAADAAAANLGTDAGGWRAEFVSLVRKCIGMNQ
jgi:Ca-activated chloride channel homolog